MATLTSTFLTARDYLLSSSLLASLPCLLLSLKRHRDNSPIERALLKTVKQKPTSSISFFRKRSISYLKASNCNLFTWSNKSLRDIHLNANSDFF